MYKTILVSELIEDAARVLQELDRQQFPIRAALWYYVPEREMWKLIIVSEIVQTHGHLEVYKRIQQALRAREVTSTTNPLGDRVLRNQLALDDILLMSPQSRQFQDLRRTIEGVTQTVPPEQRASLAGASLEDAYIYRWPTE